MRNLAIIILNWNGEDDTIECLKSIKGSCINVPYSIFVYDNSSEMTSYNKLEMFIKNMNNSLIIEQHLFSDKSSMLDYDIVLVRGNSNIGFARANNIVMKRVQNEYNYFFLLNNDTIVTHNCINEMFNYLKDNDMSVAVTCRINYFEPKDKLWNAGGKFTWYGDRKYFSEKYIKGKQVIKCDFITGCALMIKSDYMKKVDYFSEKFFFGEEDFNLCKKFKKEKYGVYVMLNILIYHKVNSSIDKLSTGYKNKIIVHYLNRIIDQRDLMDNKIIWIIWRRLYIVGIAIKSVLWKINIKDIVYIVKTLSKYSVKYDCLGKEEFEYIMSRK